MNQSFPFPHWKRSRKKRWSLGQIVRDKGQYSRNEVTLPSAKLDVLIESPPLICYGSPAHSTGALLSGVLHIAITEVAHRMIVRYLDVRLISKKTTKKPVSSHCPNCTIHSEELTRWNLIAEPLVLESGKHEFPFSCLFPGHLPASCTTSLGQIGYSLQANTRSADDEELYLETPLHVRRALTPGNDVLSTRTLPPTNLTCHLVRPSVVHPIGKFPVQMVLTGIADKENETKTLWCLRRLMWRIEEHQKIESPACQKHAAKLHGNSKHALHNAMRIIGHSEDRNSRKTGFNVTGGEIRIQFDASINSITNANCGVNAQDSLEVKHDLVVELIVADESCPGREIRFITPTGVSRLFTMKFQLHVTEHSGLSVSWDNEMPPIYEDVPPRAPRYTRLDDTSEAIEDHRGSPSPPPD
ncbi:hypothetical protein N7513_001756 [Penicillium frequentans]|nr:hypothetical protein N7513_001756 [Penicillium glabrum]